MTKKIYFAAMIVFASSVFAFADEKTLLLEIGDQFKPKSDTNRIWVQNSKILAVRRERGVLQIKSLGLGESLIKINDETKKVIVVPFNFKTSLEKWKKLKFQFPNLSPQICSISICLAGKIFSLNEYKKIISLIQHSSAPIYIGADVSENIQEEIRVWINRYFRENNLTPLKISFSKPWRVFSSTKDEIFQKRELLQNIGIQWIESQQKLNLADNIKVEIKIIEVKKEFSRTLGIKWPSEFSAQYINKKFNENQSFDLKLQAYERDGEMKVLATPNLLCRSGKSAEFFAGGEFPVKLMGHRQAEVIWKKYGIELKIKPVIDSIGQMSVELETTISSIDKSKTVDQVPALHSHKLMSHFDLAESKTIALSGLIKNESGDSSEGLPFLAQLPIIGTLFSSKDFLENRTELVILVTPKLMED
jgi:pilus assembly protein CpaC